MGRKKKTAPKPKAPQNWSCPICGSDNPGEQSCHTCNTTLVWFYKDEQDDDRGVSQPIVLRGEIAQLARAEKEPGQTWAHCFDVTLQNGTVVRVEDNAVTRRIYDPLADNPGSLEMGAEVAVFGRCHEYFDEALEGLREAATQSHVVRARIIGGGQSTHALLSQFLQRQKHDRDNPFSLRIRTDECGWCLKPITAPLSGGSVTCKKCSKTKDVLPRKTEGGWEGRGAARDPSRLHAALKAQIKSYAPDKSHLQPTLSEELTEASREFVARGTVRGLGNWALDRNGVREGDHSESRIQDAFRWGCLVAEGHCRTHGFLLARVVLDTLLDLMPDVERRDIVRCRLARAAILGGDPVAAAVWLSEAHQSSENLFVHTEVLATRALMALHQGDFDAVIRILGEQDKERLLAPDPLIHCLRSHAYAGLDQPDKARALVNKTIGRYGPLCVAWVWQLHEGPSTPLVPTRALEGKDTRSSCIKMLGGLALLLAIPFHLVFVPTCQLAFDNEVVQETLGVLNRCKVVTDHMGGNITWAVGMNSHRGCGEGEGPMRFNIKGDERRGYVALNYVKRKAGVGFSFMVVKVAGTTIDPLRCLVRKRRR